MGSLKFRISREMWAWALTVTSAACGGSQVRTADLDAWRGVEVSVLERHPIFAAMRLERRALTDGSELWIYSNCETSGGGCVPTSQYNYRTQSFVPAGQLCSAPETACCSNQFFVSAQGAVEEYRPVGACYTDDSVRPYPPIAASQVPSEPWVAPDERRR